MQKSRKVIVVSELFQRINITDFSKRIREKWKDYKLYLIIAIGTAVLAAVAAICSENNPKVTGIIQRNEPGQSEKTEEFLINVDGLIEDEPLEVTIDTRILTSEEINDLLVCATQELDEVVLGENQSLDYVVFPLNLVSSLQSGLVTASYKIENPEIMDTRGNPIQENLVSEGTLTEITAKLKCQDKSTEYHFFARVFPEEKTEKESFIDGLKKALASQNENEGGLFILPSVFEGRKITWSTDKKTGKALTIFVLGIVTMGLVALGKRNDERRLKNEKEKSLREDYPRIINQMSLLLSAGMTVSATWEKMVKNHQVRKQKTPQKKNKFFEPGFEEMERTYRQIKDGVSEMDAYEEFGERTGLSEYRKLSTLLVQNLRKGTVGLSEILEKEGIEAYARQESMVKKKGEELSTKLLIPMMTMLGLVIVVIVIPAIFKFRI